MLKFHCAQFNVLGTETRILYMLRQALCQLSHIPALPLHFE